MIAILLLVLLGCGGTDSITTESTDANELAWALPEERTTQLSDELQPECLLMFDVDGRAHSLCTQDQFCQEAAAMDEYAMYRPLFLFICSAAEHVEWGAE